MVKQSNQLDIKMSDKWVFGAVLLQFVMILVFIAIAFVFQSIDNVCVFTLARYFHFGPSDDLCFITSRINTWWKWIIILIMTMMMDASATFSSELYSPWVSNVLGDPYGSPTNKHIAHGIQQIRNINYYLQNAIWTFVALTQVDLLLFSLLASCAICFYTTKKYLDAKSLLPESKVLNPGID